MLFVIHLTHPRGIVIAKDQPLLSVQPLQYRFRFLAAEEHIAHNTDGIGILYPAVPVLNDRFVHFLYCLKWTVTELQHVSVSEMGIGYEVKNCCSLPSQSIVIVEHELQFIYLLGNVVMATVPFIIDELAFDFAQPDFGAFIYFRLIDVRHKGFDRLIFHRTGM